MLSTRPQAQGFLIDFFDPQRAGAIIDVIRAERAKAVFASFADQAADTVRARAELKPADPRIVPAFDLEGILYSLRTKTAGQEPEGLPKTASLPVVNGKLIAFMRARAATGPRRSRCMPRI